MRPKTHIQRQMAATYQSIFMQPLPTEEALYAMLEKHGFSCLIQSDAKSEFKRDDNNHLIILLPLNAVISEDLNAKLIRWFQGSAIPVTIYVIKQYQDIFESFCINIQLNDNKIHFNKTIIATEQLELPWASLSIFLKIIGTRASTLKNNYHALETLF